MQPTNYGYASNRRIRIAVDFGRCRKGVRDRVCSRDVKETVKYGTAYEDGDDIVVP